MCCYMLISQVPHVYYMNNHLHRDYYMTGKKKRDRKRKTIINK